MDNPNIIDVLFHIGIYLEAIVRNYGFWTYLFMFAIIFCETGLVFTPFLPGDSLIFTAGALAASGIMQLELIIPIIGLAAVAGDTSNYLIGRFLGNKLFKKEKSVLFNKKHLVQTENFYQKHGRKTIIIARVIPVIRTFAPFVAGIGKMDYLRFFSYNVIGGFGWVAIFSLGGFFFGNLPVIKNNFSLVLICIIIISVLPAIIMVLKNAVHKTRKMI